MLHLKAFVKKTAGGQIHRVVKEHYVRDDIEYALSGDHGAWAVRGETML